MTGYFVQLSDGVVQQVRCVSAERIASFPELYPGEWMEVTDIQYFPAVGYLYESTTGFRPPKPYPSWTWDATTKEYKSPVPMPIDDSFYVWDEQNLQWSKIE